jgi:hypothetical protein
MAETGMLHWNAYLTGLDMVSDHYPPKP